MGFVNVERQGHVGILTIDRQEALNALNSQVLTDLDAAIDQVAAVENLAAVRLGPGIALVVISVVLSLAAGLAPSRMAAKKDPVTALRTE